MRDILQERAGTAGERVRRVHRDQPVHHAVAVERGQQAGPGGVPAARTQPGQCDVRARVDDSARLDAQVGLLRPEPRQQRHRRHRPVVGQQRAGRRPALFQRGDPLAATGLPGAEAQVRPAGHHAGGDDVAGAVHAQVLVAADPVADVHPGLGEPVGVRPLARGDQYQVGGDVLAVVQGQPPPVAPPFHRGNPPAEPGLDPVGPVRLGDERADRLAERAIHEGGLGVDDDGAAGQSPYRTGRLAAGQPAADDGDPVGVVQLLAHRPGVVKRVQGVQAGLADRPAGRYHRGRAGRDDQAVVLERLVVVGDHDLVLRVQVHRAPAQPQVHRRLGGG